MSPTPEDIHILIPRTYDCDLIWKEKKVFADVIKLRILRWGNYPELSGWNLNVVIYVLIRKRQEQITHSRREDTEEEKAM